MTGTQRCQITFPVVIRQIDKWAYIDRRFRRHPSISSENFRQSSYNARLAPELTELKHQSQSAQLVAERAKNLRFTALLDNGVEVIRSDDAARNEFKDARHHPRVLRRPHGQRHYSDESPIFARRKDRELPVFSKMLPPVR